MRRVSPFRTERRQLEIKMTPMIDVVFLLLIFFVLTASFQVPEQILPSDLSAPGRTPVEEPIDQELDDLEEVVVKVTQDGERTQWKINETRYDSLDNVRRVLSALVRLEAGLPVILDVAGDVPLGRVIDVYDLCRAVGFEKVQFAASIKV